MGYTVVEISWTAATDGTRCTVLDSTPLALLGVTADQLTYGLRV